MNRPSHSRLPAFTSGLRLFAAGVLALVFAISLPLTSEAQRRDFSASYRVSNIVETMDSVSLKLSFTIHNSSGADISNGAIALYSFEGPHSTLVDSFELTKRLISYKDLTVSHDFTISKHDYGRWKLGETPTVKFLLPDSEGATRIVPIDLRLDTMTVSVAK